MSDQLKICAYTHNTHATHTLMYRVTAAATSEPNVTHSGSDSLLSDDTTSVELVDHNAPELSGTSTGSGGGGAQSMDTTHQLESFPTLSSSSLPTQENIVKFAEKYSLNNASKRFDIPVATIKRWMKSNWVPLKPKYNSPGQGRKISYSAELEREMAEHIRDLLARGEKVAMQSLCSYARSRVQEEVPEFTASTGWANRFLARNNIDLTDQKEQRRDVGVPLKDNRSPDSRGRPLSYSVETDQAIANHVRQRLAHGYSLSNSELRRYAKDIIIKENRKFTGSASWAQNFLHRHKINLQSPDSKEPGLTSPVPSHGSPSLSTASPSTSLFSAPLHNSQAQYVGSALPSSPQYTSTTHLNPATEMHVVASSAPGFPGPSPSDGVLGLPVEYATDDTMKQALAILTGENIDTGILNAAQLASLQATLGELSSTDTVSLVDLLNTAQQIQEQTGESGSAAALITHGLDSSASGLYLANSDVFGSGLTGVAATQVNPNTQAPTVPNPPRPSVSTHPEMDANPSSRPLSYAKETDLMLAKWVQDQQAAGTKVTFASLRAYAKNLVSSENPNFNASVGWVTPFLLRHGLDLSINKKKATRKTDSSPVADIHVDMSDEGQTLADQPTKMPKQPSTSVHSILQEEEPITPEQMMVPVQLVSSGATPETSMISTPVTTCSPATLEGIRAVLEQDLATDCSQTEQIQFAAQFHDQPLTLAQTPTSLSRVVEETVPQDTHIVSIDSQVLSEGRPQRTRVPPSKYLPREEDEEKPPVRKRTKIPRNRHRLSDKLDLVRLMREHNLAPHYICRMLGIANSTLAGWIKLVQQKGEELEVLSLNKKRSNLSGQGRPLTYSKEKDEAIAEWVQLQQKLGVQLMPADLAKYAQGLIREENPNFTASSGWAQKFLQRHSLQLTGKSCTGGSTPGSSGASADNKPSSPAVVEEQYNIPAAIQTEEVIANEFSQEKPYSEEIEKHLVTWVKENIATNGSLSLQTLCHYAEDVVIPQNPMFVASLSWVCMFLHTHSLMLDPKPNVVSVCSAPIIPRKRASSEPTLQSDPASTPKKHCPDVVSDTSVSPSTGNLCEALLALSNQPQEPGQASNSSVQAVLQVALRALHQQQQQKQQQQLEVQEESLVGGAELVKGMEGKETVPAAGVGSGTGGRSDSTVIGKEKAKPTPKKKGASNTAGLVSPDKDGSSNTYFGKPAREFSVEEKEEVVRYANATTLQKAAMKYGVAAPTVWRWRVELKLHQPKYSAMQKKYIIKFAETNSLKEAAQRYGITGKTISNWRKALQADGELSGDASGLLTQESQADSIETTPGDSQSSEVVFHFFVDGGEVVEVTGTVAQNVTDDGDSGLEQGTSHGDSTAETGSSVPLEVTNEVDIENVGMEYDVVSSEGHVAKPRCTPQEKVQILQYALDHSIKEASQKFGVSPGTLYYWKRSRNSGKESGKEPEPEPDPEPEPAPSLRRSQRTHIRPVIEYSDGIEETSVLASSSDDTVVQPEQFIASSDAIGSATDPQTATIQILSQALVGVSPDALQHLNPDLTLLQAVSSLLAGEGGQRGGAVNDEEKANKSKQQDSNSEGISSPTEVLVRPFPPQEQATSNERPEHTKSEVEGSRMEEIAPHLVSEEVVMIGDSSNEAAAPEEETPTGEHPIEEKAKGSPIAASDVLTPIEHPSTAITEGGTDKDNDKVTSSQTGSQDQLVPLELEVVSLPHSSSLSDPVAEVPLAQNDKPPSTTGSSAETNASNTLLAEGHRKSPELSVNVSPVEEVPATNVSSPNNADTISE